MNRKWPTWIREFDLALPITSQFLLTGNINDFHVGVTAAGALSSTTDAIRTCLIENGYELVYRSDPVLGIVVDHKAEGIDSGGFFPDAHLNKITAATPSRLADLLRRATTQCELLVAVVIEDASTFWPEDASPETRSLQLISRRLAARGTTYTRRSVRQTPLANCVIWLSERQNDAPSWLLSTSTTRTISIATPGLSVRRDVSYRVLADLPSAATSPAGVERAADVMAASSEGLTVRDLCSIATLAADGDIAVDHIDEAIRSYLSGVLESPWQDPRLLERLERADELINHRVLGQDEAIQRALDVLIRSAMGLTGAQTGGRVGRPQGILFFAGPTGVGKTELAKALAETLFGSEDACIRFDMSEFSAEQSEARLIGAPPGYVGFSAGGELTNAVRQRPFSILLFDEIEKAHPRILDKFLQILEDGRLTDGSGSTVYFGETVIVFTSNIGTTPTAHGVDPAAQRARIREAIERHFAEGISRPELLNRIGENIIVFDPISERVGRRLVRKYVDSVLAVLAARLGVSLSIDDAVLEGIEAAAIANLRFGGRGVGTVVEITLVNPLTRALMHRPRPGKYRVLELTREHSRWTINLSDVPD